MNGERCFIAESITLETSNNDFGQIRSDNRKK